MAAVLIWLVCPCHRGVYISLIPLCVPFIPLPPHPSLSPHLSLPPHLSLSPLTPLPPQALRRYSEAVKDLHLLLTIDPDNAPAKRELGEAKQLWEKQLREIQANASSKDTRPERRNPKSKAGKKSRENAQKPPSKDGPQKPPPTKEELEKFQKLLQELEASKEKIEQLSKMAPPGTSWGSQEGGVGDLPFTGPPQATQGKAPNGGRKQPSGKASGGKTPTGTGKSPGKPKKKVPKKPPKVTTKQEKPVPSDTAGLEVKGQSPPTSKGKRIEIEEIHSSDDESPEVATPPTPEVTTPPTPEDPTPPTPDVTTPLVVDDTAGVKTESDQDRGSPPTLVSRTFCCWCTVYSDGSLLSLFSAHHLSLCSNGMRSPVQPRVQSTLVS